MINNETSSTEGWERRINKSNFSGVETITSTSSAIKKSASVGSISLAEDVRSTLKPIADKSLRKSKYTWLTNALDGTTYTTLASFRKDFVKTILNSANIVLPALVGICTIEAFA